MRWTETVSGLIGRAVAALMLGGVLAGHLSGCAGAEGKDRYVDTYQVLPPYTTAPVLHAPAAEGVSGTEVGNVE